MQKIMRKGKKNLGYDSIHIPKGLKKVQNLFYEILGYSPQLFY